MDQNNAIAVALLLVAVMLLLGSTRQGGLWLRVSVWIAGLLALIGAVALVAADDSHSGLFRAVADLAEHWREPSTSVLAQALGRNSASVERFVLPLLDLFLVFGSMLALLALLSLTPGERLEKAIRPLMIGFIGAIAGGALSLAVAGTGFGSASDQRVYANYVVADDVSDGDTFWVGETSIRLLNVDALERAQMCRRDGVLEPCGEAAAAHLATLVDQALVTCEVSENGAGRTRESFGRPLAQCRAIKGRQNYDVGTRMIREGYAVHYGGEESPTALRERRGILGACTLHPSVWRNDHAAREAFLSTGELPANAEQSIGACDVSSDNPR